jgi:hypothetical protein
MLRSTDHLSRMNNLLVLVRASISNLSRHSGYLPMSAQFEMGSLAMEFVASFEYLLTVIYNQQSRTIGLLAVGRLRDHLVRECLIQAKA